ncbi:MAG: hypothetical protein ACYDDA_15615 [Acidiferrobacteraceae bacterium]
MTDDLKWHFFSETDPTTGGGQVEVTVSMPADCMEDPESIAAFTEGLGTWLGGYFCDRFSVLEEGKDAPPRKIGCGPARLKPLGS